MFTVKNIRKLEKIVFQSTRDWLWVSVTTRINGNGRREVALKIRNTYFQPKYWDTMPRMTLPSTLPAMEPRPMKNWIFDSWSLFFEMRTAKPSVFVSYMATKKVNWIKWLPPNIEKSIIMRNPAREILGRRNPRPINAKHYTVYGKRCKPE